MVNESSPLLEKEEGSHRYYHVLESAEIGIDDPESSSTTNITTTSSLLSSNKQASINIIKMCIGSGTLAMPYAAHQGGVLFHVFGLAMITKWNLYSVDRMLSSKQILCQYECMKKMQNDSNNHDHHIQKDTETSDRTKLTKSTMSNQKGSNTVIFEKESKSTFSNIACMVFGPIGVHMVDTVMTILMVGIILAYEDAILGFIQQTPLQSDNPRFNAIFMVLFIVPVLMLPNYESIAKVSALGTGLVCAVFGIVAVMGILQNGFAGFFTISWDNLWPSSLSSLSSWFGIAVFGYGIVPFTFTMQESMVHPSEFKNSCNISLWIVFVAYCIMGNGLSIIFMQTINSDVLSVLPHGIVPTSLRLLMVIVILTTLPLIIIPAGALVHDKVFGTTKGSYIFPIRLFIAIICAVLSVELPNFVFVLSFIGCLCVSFISFVYPPLVHIICTNKFNLNPMSLQTLFLDGTMLTWGIFVTIFTSRQTYLSMMQQK